MTPAEFKAILPEFVDVTEARIQTLLDRATPWFDVIRWDTFYSEGIANWVAHKIVTAPPPGVAPFADPAGVTVEMVGSVRIERASAVVEKEAADPFLSSQYGREYVRLRTLVGAGAALLVP